MKEDKGKAQSQSLGEPCLVSFQPAMRSEGTEQRQGPPTLSVWPQKELCYRAGTWQGLMLRKAEPEMLEGTQIPLRQGILPMSSQPSVRPRTNVSKPVRKVPA